MIVRLICTRADGDILVDTRIDHFPVVIGRGAECDIVLNEKSISNKHVTLSVQNGEILLEDVGSSNGIWSGEQKVNRILGKKIECQLGRVRASFYLLGAEVEEKTDFIQIGEYRNEIQKVLQTNPAAAVEVNAEKSSSLWHTPWDARKSLIGLATGLLFFGLYVVTSGNWEPLEVIIELLTGVLALITSTIVISVVNRVVQKRFRFWDFFIFLFCCVAILQSVDSTLNLMFFNLGSDLALADRMVLWIIRILFCFIVYIILAMIFRFNTALKAMGYLLLLLVLGKGVDYLTQYQLDKKSKYIVKTWEPMNTQQRLLLRKLSAEQDTTQSVLDKMTTQFRELKKLSP